MISQSIKINIKMKYLLIFWTNKFYKKQNKFKELEAPSVKFYIIRKV